MMRQRLAADVPRLAAGAVFACFLLYYGLCCFRVDWGGDFQMYCAGVARLHRDLLHPAHEAMSAPGSQSTVYTPYLVLVAAAGKLLGLTPYRALQLAGLADLVAYALALAYFVSRYSMHRRTALPAACFLLVTLLVRWHHFGWSSETSVLTMQFVQSYPSTVAWALAFLAFGVVEDFRRARRRALLPALGLIVCCLLLVHVITASWVIGIVMLRGLHVLAMERGRDWKFAVLLVAAIVAGFALATLWPYSAFFGQSGMTEVREPSKFGRHPFLDFLNLYVVALPSAVWLLVRFRRHGFFLLGFVATLAALELWRALGISYGNRYSFFMAFFAQFLVAEAAAAGMLAIRRGLDEIDSTGALAPARLRRLDRPIALLLLAAASLSWLPSPMWQEARRKRAALSSPIELWRRRSAHDNYYAQFGSLPAHLGPGDTVIMPVSRSAFDLAAVTGARVVSSPNAHRVPDAKIRERELDRFFADRTSPDARMAIVRRHCATKVLLFGKNFPLLPAMERMFGLPLFRDPDRALFDTGRAGSGNCVEQRIESPR